MVGQMALGVAGMARGALSTGPQVSGDEAQGILAGRRASRLPSVVRQITGPAGVSAPGQHPVGGDARWGAVSYPLQRQRPPDHLPVHQRDDVDSEQAAGDVRLRAYAKGTCLRAAS